MLARGIIVLALIAYAIASSVPSSERPPFLLPVPSGPYVVKAEVQELTDSSRMNCNSTGPRRLMISRFDPVPKKHCIATKDVPTFPPVSAKFEDLIIEENWDYAGRWIRGLFAASRIKVCSKVNKEYASNTEQEKLNHGFPVLLLSPGGYLTRLVYSSLAQTIASKGYTVITIDHPGDTDVVEFLNGDLIFGTDANNSYPSTWNEIRVKDARFVLDETMKKSPHVRVGILGHSLGGSAALSATFEDERIKAGINFDGSIFGPVVEAGLGERNQSFMFFGARGHERSVDPGWATLWNTTDRRYPDAWKKEINLSEGRHNIITDFPVIFDAANVRDVLDVDIVYRIAGNIKSSRAQGMITAYVHDFFQFALGFTKDEGLLKEPTLEWPEIYFPDVGMAM
ncbi:hypothetical protein FQN49_000278 [Arthroderma sp. PD_2]|nr:hypothetical protein FQN49_000278 [Arthroderma sp. PD_2]